MGSVYQRKDGRWVAKYQDLEGSWRYIYGKSKDETKQALRAGLRNQEEGINLSKISVQEYLDPRVSRGLARGSEGCCLREDFNSQEG
jgi:hypothetical protein